MSEVSNESYEAKYKYLLAEYDNYRKRVEKEAEIKIMDVKAKLLLKLINIRDDFERAIKASEEGNTLIMNGLKSILKHIDNILKEEGVREIDTSTKFDPHLHEVISIVVDNNLPDYSIIRELRKGYMLYDRVIRPSLVEVSKQDTLQKE